MSDQSELFIEKELLAPYTYFSNIKGKRRYLELFFTFNHWLQVPAEKIKPLWDIANMLYTTCSMTDDMQDDAKFRGVKPAAHRVYGVPLTINAAFYVLLQLLEKAANLCPEACKVIIEEYLDLFRGQGTEMYWRDNIICPTEELYRKMAAQQSGGFFMGLIRLIQVFSENKTDYRHLVYTISIFLKINDDYCNLNHQEGLEVWPEEKDKKVDNDVRFCEDITEGKFSFPIMHATRTEYGEQILNILRRRTDDVSLKKYCLSLIEKAGSLQHTRDVMAELKREAQAEIARLGGNPELEAKLEQFICS